MQGQVKIRQIGKFYNFKYLVLLEIAPFCGRDWVCKMFKIMGEIKIDVYQLKRMRVLAYEEAVGIARRRH